MSVSSSNNFTQNRNQIIDRTLSILGVKSRGRSLSSEEVNDASDALNLMIKGIKANGDFLWKNAEGTLFLTVGTAKYTLDGSSAHATESFTETTTSAAAISGATSITVTSASGFTVGYNIGIVQDDNTIKWTTIASIASTTIGLNAALTAAAASGNTVFVYQTKINRPESISSCRRRDADDNDVPLNDLSRSDYFNLSNKTTQGKPTQFYYDKQLSAGDLYLYNTPDLVTDTIKFTFQKMFFDFDASTDDPDFPIEWVEALAFALADRLSYDYGIEATKAERIKRTADEMLANLQGYDREESIYFAPSITLYSR